MGHGYRPIISKIRFENPNKKETKKKNYNLLHYIATREGVDLTRVNTMEYVVNENIDLNDAGEKKLYNDAGNDLYLKYIAHRPRSHGLFGNIDTEKFENVSKILNRVSDEKKLVYRGIISLSELDAQALGYNNVEKWDLYLKSVMPDIATTLGLSPNDIIWVAAFHAEQKHPHVHYMLWDNRDIVQKAYICEAQQKACRDICQNAMFTEENEAIIREITAAEREEYYEVQNTSRKNVTGYIRDAFSNDEYIPGVYSEKLPGRIDEEIHKELNELYRKVLDTLPGRGKIAYQYMPLECKAYIDRITDVFLKQPEIKDEYNKYVKSIKDIHKSLGETKEEINQAKEYALKEMYTRTGNIILKGICSIKEEILDERGADRSSIQDANDNIEVADRSDMMSLHEEMEIRKSDMMSPEENFENSKTGFIKNINSLLNRKSDKYNPLEGERILIDTFESASPKLKKYICKKLGELYTDNNSIMEDYNEALYYLEDCMDSSEQDSDINVLLGKIYGDKHYSKYNSEVAEKHYLQAIEDENKSYIRLKLSRMYTDKESVLYDYDKALDILESKSDYIGSVSLQKGNIYSEKESPFYDMDQAVKFYKMSAAKGNSFGAYWVGKILTNAESEFYNLKEGVEYLEKAATAEKRVMPAQIKLGKIYMDKEGIFYSIPKAYLHLTDALDSLSKLEKKEYSKLSLSEWKSKALICFYLGKIYTEQNTKHNYEEALEHYKLSIEAYDKVGESNNVIINHMYVRMAQIYADKNERFYNPEKAEGYLMKALHNLQELQKQQVEEPELQDRRTVQNILLKLSNLYMDDESTLYNLDKAMYVLQHEIDENGIFDLKRGNIYANESYAGYNMQKALECYKQSAAHLNTTAMVKLAKCYLYGMGVDKDRTEALYWLNKAVDEGDQYAKEYLKNMESMKFNNFTYSMLRQIFSSMTQTRTKSMQRLQEAEFKSNSKQAKKEEYLHRN